MPRGAARNRHGGVRCNLRLRTRACATLELSRIGHASSQRISFMTQHDDVPRLSGVPTAERSVRTVVSDKKPSVFFAAMRARKRFRLPLDVLGGEAFSDIEIVVLRCAFLEGIFDWRPVDLSESLLPLIECGKIARAFCHVPADSGVGACICFNRFLFISRSYLTRR